MNGENGKRSRKNGRVGRQDFTSLKVIFLHIRILIIIPKPIIAKLYWTQANLNSMNPRTSTKKSNIALIGNLHIMPIVPSVPGPNREARMFMEGK